MVVIFIMDLLLVREAKIDTKRRVHITLELVLFGQIVRVISQCLHISGIQFDNLQIGLDTGRRDRLGENRAASSD